MNTTLKQGTISIVIAEDHKQLREQYVQSLTSYNIRTIGQADNGEQTLKLLERLEPDVLLLDLGMPIMDGNAVMKKIQVLYPKLKVIILSHYDSSILVKDFIARGAMGYIPKNEGDVTVLVDAIQRVNNGETVVIETKSFEKNIDRLFSKRQIQMIPMMCDGLTNKQMAENLGIAERSVEKQRQKIYFKSNVGDFTSFLKFAVKKGLDYLSISRTTK